MKKFIITLFLTLAPLIAYAGGGNGKVLSYLAMANGVFMFKIEVINNTPSCNVAREWVVNLNTAGARAIMATVMTAHAQARGLSVVGAGNCTIWLDREDVQYVWVAD